MSGAPDYVIPAGALSGRLLSSLSPAEKKALGRTRITALAEARARLRVRPEPTDDAAPCLILPIVRYTPPPDQPRPQPRGVGLWMPRMPAPVARFLRLWKVVICLITLVIMYPEIAKAPGFVSGWIVRAVATRIKLACSLFVTTFVEQLGDLVTEGFEWLDAIVTPTVPLLAPAAKPGHAFFTFATGLVVLKYMNPFW